MNILKREWKAGLKPFLFWSLGLFVLIFAGVVKSTGTTGGNEINELIASFPRIVLAVFGMAGVDISTFDGFYTILAQYGVLITAVYAVHLGNGAVSNEAVDKTYEFVFTKPCSRTYVLGHKLFAGFTYLVLFCTLHFAFSALAVTQLHLSQDYSSLFWRYAAVSFFVGGLFFGLGAMFASLAKSAEMGSKIGNYSIMIAFCLSVLYDMLENARLLKLISPFKYFLANDLIAGHLDFRYALLCLGICALALLTAFRAFEKRDLNAA